MPPMPQNDQMQESKETQNNKNQKSDHCLGNEPRAARNHDPVLDRILLRTDAASESTEFFCDHVEPIYREGVMSSETKVFWRRR